MRQASAKIRYPKKYDIGGYYDAASYTRPDGLSMRNRSAVYVQGVQTVWRPNPATNQSITLFGGALVYNGGAPYWGAILRRRSGSRPFPAAAK